MGARCLWSLGRGLRGIGLARGIWLLALLILLLINLLPLRGLLRVMQSRSDGVVSLLLLLAR